ncbi:MAG: hypothetical protein GVY19_05950 [Bacteroidetes bacterium]|nr:hypothetical protein [Bacteroidota bacterium]
MKGTVLNKLHPELDTIVHDFISNRLLEGAEYRYRHKPYKVERDKKCCEVVIPFEFSIKRFYRKPVNYYHFHHFQHHMMHQHMIHHAPPTRGPGGF